MENKLVSYNSSSSSPFSVNGFEFFFFLLLLRDSEDNLTGQYKTQTADCRLQTADRVQNAD